MKKVISGIELEEKMMEAINLLCDTVKQTLGPKGNNIIIDHSNFTPFITNDGVTIAQNIESDEETVNTILEIAKEASIKTNEKVGDGTTTTLVLLQSIYNTAKKYIKKGENPIVLKKEIDKCLKDIIKKLERDKIKPNKTTLKKIATIAANDSEIGKLVSKVYKKIDDKNNIIIKETDETKLNCSFLKGYYLESTLASPYLLKDQLTLNFKDAYILIVNNSIEDINNLSSLLNDIMKNNKNLIILANDYSEYFINDIVSLCLQEELHCCLLKISEYGMKKKYIEKDLEIITNAKIVQSDKNLSYEVLGQIENISISKENTRIDFKLNKNTKKYRAIIKAEADKITDSFEKEFYLKRIAMFSSGIAKIEIGAPTKTELREKRMRLEDAICAFFSAKEGIVLGGGISFLKIAHETSTDTVASKILVEALTKPFEQIMTNDGLESEKIKRKIQEKNYKYVYNVTKDIYEEEKDTEIFDSFQVVKNALINACSIATMLLTTKSLIINERLNNLNKINEYENL